MSSTRQAVGKLIVASFAAVLSSCVYATGQGEGPVDPGLRGGNPGAGGPLPGLTQDELAFFNDGLTRFVSVESVSWMATSVPLVQSIERTVSPQRISTPLFSCRPCI